MEKKMPTMFVADDRVVWRVVSVTNGVPLWRADNFRTNPDAAWGWGYMRLGNTVGPTTLGISEDDARRIAA